MCRVLKVHRSGYYAWLREPLSPRAKANEKLTSQIREFYDQSMGIYGSPRFFCDLKEAGVACSENRVARLMRSSQIKSMRGYKRPRYKVGKPAQLAPNQLGRQFQHDEPDQARDEAKSEFFDYIEVFYNRVRRHKHLDQLSPHEFERQRQTAL
jgi:putative transposase